MRSLKQAAIEQIDGQAMLEDLEQNEPVPDPAG